MKRSCGTDILIASNHGVVLSFMRRENIGGSMNWNKEEAEFWKAGLLGQSSGRCWCLSCAHAESAMVYRF
jgi:hypothetical protein